MLDPIPSLTEGNIVLIGHGLAARAHVLSDEELKDGLRRYRFTDHHATCRPSLVAAASAAHHVPPTFPNSPYPENPE